MRGFPPRNDALAVDGHCQCEGLNSSVAQLVEHDTKITEVGCPIARVAQSDNMILY